MSLLVDTGLPTETNVSFFGGGFGASVLCRCFCAAELELRSCLCSGWKTMNDMLAQRPQLPSSLPPQLPSSLPPCVRKRNDSEANVDWYPPPTHHRMMVSSADPEKLHLKLFTVLAFFSKSIGTWCVIAVSFILRHRSSLELWECSFVM